MCPTLRLWHTDSAFPSRPAFLHHAKATDSLNKMVGKISPLRSPGFELTLSEFEAPTVFREMTRSIQGVVRYA